MKKEAKTLLDKAIASLIVVAIKRVNELDFYNLGAKAVAEKVGLTVHQTLAVVEHLKLQSDESCFKPLQIGSQLHKRYSQNVLPKIQAVAASENLQAIVESYTAGRRKPRFTATRTD